MKVIKNMILVVGLLILMLVVMRGISFISRLTTGEERTMEREFYVNSWSSSLGVKDNKGLDLTVFSYEIDLINNKDEIIEIKEIQPIIRQEIEHLVREVINPREPNQIMNNETIEVEGKIEFDTEGLNKDQILELEPFITGIKITTDTKEIIVDL